MGKSHIAFVGIPTIFGAPSLKLITVKLPEAILEGLDELVRAGMYQNRSAAIRAAVRDMLKKELWRTEET